MEKLKIGVIGLGRRMTWLVGLLLETGRVELAAVCDPRSQELRQEFPDARYYDDARTMLDTEKLHGVMIGTRCPLHTQYALLCAEYRIPIYLEKPVSISEAQLEQLRQIDRHLWDQIVVSFPLRRSRLCTYAREKLDSGAIGTVLHAEAWCHPPYGRGYYHKWYRDSAVTGGMFLQKATHDLDYLRYLLGGAVPTEVCAMTSRQSYGGTEPAGKLCEDCSQRTSCPESPANIEKAGGPIDPLYKHCCYAQDVTIEDSGSCLLRFPDGMHIAYSQDFNSRNEAGKRGARIIGYKGTLEFDWYTGVVTVYHHDEPLTESHRFTDTGGSHFGGDGYLIENFIAVMEGREKSLTTLEDGIISASVCLACRKSAETGRFIPIT